MTLFPTIDEILAQHLLQQGFSRFPVARTLYADIATPIQVARVLKSLSYEMFLLESIQDGTHWGRYSFLGYKPSATFSAKHWHINIHSSNNDLLAYLAASIPNHTYSRTAHNNRDSLSLHGDPKHALRLILNYYKSPKLPYLPPFTGGLVGYVAYDAIRYAEACLDFPKAGDIYQGSISSAKDHSSNANCHLHPATQYDWKRDNSDDICLLLFEHIVAFDNFTQKIFLITNLNLHALESSHAHATQELATLATLLTRFASSKHEAFHHTSSYSHAAFHSTDSTPANANHVNSIFSTAKATPSHASSNTTPYSSISAPTFAPFCLQSPFKKYFTQEQFIAQVKRAQDYITQGDIFQVVLSNPQQARASGSLFDVYRVLRTSNPSPYMFYIVSDDVEITGASPETLARLEGNMLYTYPLAGSRPRGRNDDEDARLMHDLLHDAKELSEHNMLVDLARNDVGRIARIGSVEVAHYQHIVKYAHIMHIASTVRATLLDEADALQALEAILPAGTLSGAPKIRACEIIYELEDMAHAGLRGIYGGAIGYFDFSGNMDTCIGIRLVYKHDGYVFVRSGAGIVHDSDALSEWKELESKARAILDALHRASGGLAEFF